MDKYYNGLIVFFILIIIIIVLIILGMWKKNKRLLKEKNLYETITKMTIIVNQVAGIIFVTDVNGNIQYVNPSFEKLTGYSKKEVLGKNPKIISSKLMNESYYKDLWDTLLAGQVFKADTINRKKNGELFYYDQTVTPIIDNNNITTNFVSTGKDITARKKAEDDLLKYKSHLEQLIEERTKALTISENRYRVLTELSPVGIFNADKMGKVVYVNDKWCQISGLSKEDSLGNGWINAISSEDKERIVSILRDAVKGQKNFSFEYKLSNKDKNTNSGKEKWMMSQSIAQFENDGEFIGHIGSVTDISEIKYVEYKLNEARKGAEAANIAKSAFVANMSHEIRTPLNAILGFSQLMLQDTTLNVAQKDKIKIMTRSGEHLLSIINDILEISKVEAGGTKLNKNSLDLNLLLLDIENMFRIRCSEKDLELSFEKDFNFPIYIYQDEKKLRQVLINIIGNSIKFTNKGQIRVKVNSFKTEKGYNNIAFSVKDTGIGIPDADIDKVFGYFVQAQNAVNIKGGTGLGLTISKNFINLMGGDISMKSSLGQGTEVIFNILAEDGNQEKIEKNIYDNIKNIKLKDFSTRILIVDDNEDNRALLRNILKPKGFKVKEAVNGLEAVNITKEWKPNLVFMDMRMPVMNGYEAVKRIRKWDENKAISIVLITSSVFNDENNQDDIIKEYDMLYKPFTLNQLYRVMKKYLDIEIVEKDNNKKGREKLCNSQLSDSINKVPGDIIEKLKSAVVDGDTDLIYDLLTKINEYDFKLAAFLEELVDKFQFDKINEILNIEIFNSK